MKVKISKYAYVYEKSNNKYSFFQARHIYLLEGEKEDHDVFMSYLQPRELDSDATSTFLYKKGFLVPDSLDEETALVKEKIIRYQKAKTIRDNRVGYLRISLTEVCNMRCKYCFVNKIYDSKSSMSLETFEKVMDRFIRGNKGKRVLVQYFGGEPLLRMDLVSYGHDMLEKSKKMGWLKGYSEEIVSNGTLLNDENMDFLLNNNISLSVSLDGPKEINDENRIFNNGTGTYDTVVDNLKKYKEKGGRISLFLTPNDSNLKYFKDIISYFYESFHPSEISVNTPQPYEYGWEVDGLEVAKAMQDTIMYCKDKEIIYNTPANNLIFLINHGLQQTYSCMNLTYGKNENTWGIYVSSEGKTSKCVVNNCDECSVDFDDFLMNDEFIDWHFKPSINKVCLSCPAVNVCGGPCSIERVLSKNGRNIEKCKFVKEMLKWLLINDI